QSGTASHQCMPGIRAALGVPGVGDEGGPVNAREARIGGDARAAVVGRHENVAHGGGAKTAPEAGLARRGKARVFVVESGYAEAERAVGTEPAVTRCNARTEPRSALTPFRRLIVRLSERGAKGRVHQGFDSEN